MARGRPLGVWAPARVSFSFRIPLAASATAFARIGACGTTTAAAPQPCLMHSRCARGAASCSAASRATSSGVWEREQPQVVHVRCLCRRDGGAVGRPHAHPRSPLSRRASPVQAGLWEGASRLARIAGYGIVKATRAVARSTSVAVVGRIGARSAEWPLATATRRG